AELLILQGRANRAMSRQSAATKVFLKCLVQCLALTVVLAGVRARAQGAQAREPAENFPFAKGVIIESVTCAAQPEQTYALFLPSTYTPARRWPIVYAFDPAARGRLPVKLLQDVAERYGYIVVGSNNSRNGPSRPQQDAATAIWDDTHRRFAIDNRRVYVTGFSGGARFATFLALGCGCVTGVIAHGAGFPVSATPTGEEDFSYFSAIGDLDFNYPELVQLAARLDKLGVTNRLRRFHGPHQWAPAEVWVEAIEWMELLAMKGGTRTGDEEFIARQVSAALEKTRALEDAGELYAASYEYRKLVQAFQGLADVSLFARKAAELEATEAVRAARKREQEEISRQEKLTADFFAHLVALKTEPAARPTTLSLLESKLRELRDEVNSAEEPEQAIVPRRTLRKVFALAYESGQMSLRRNNPALAAAYFEVATIVFSQGPMAFFQLARARAQAGDQSGALAALKQAVEKGFKNAALLRESEEFAALRDGEDFRALLRSLAPPPSQ
ncbi:MAG: hypothetical protein ACE5HB_10900, partial [Terriglobia bacterium]